MKLLGVFFVILYAGVAYSQDEVLEDSLPAPSCPSDNEEYKECGTACPATCDNFMNKILFCTDNCVEGCFCKDPFVRDATGECVPRAGCKRCQDPNAQIVKCPNPCPLEGTCTNPAAPYICRRACVPWGCSCKSGFVKGPDSNCILLAKCPQKKKTCAANSGTCLLTHQCGKGKIIHGTDCNYGKVCCVLFK